MVRYSYIRTWKYSSTYRTLLSGFNSLTICLYTRTYVYRNTPVYLGHSFLSSLVRADFVSSCLPVLRRWSSRFCPPRCFFFFFSLMLWHRVLLHVTLACAFALIWISLCSVVWLCSPAQWLLLQDYWKTEYLLLLSSSPGSSVGSHRLWLGQ